MTRAVTSDIEEKLLKSLVQILILTEGGKLDWSQGVRENSFQASFSGLGVEIEKDGGWWRDVIDEYSGDPVDKVWVDDYRYRIFDRSGALRLEAGAGRMEHVFRSYEISEIDSISPRISGGRDLLERLWHVASERARGVMDALDELLNDVSVLSEVPVDDEPGRAS